MNSFFFFNDTATTEIYTLSLHDALPILPGGADGGGGRLRGRAGDLRYRRLQLPQRRQGGRSEEHTSELQSRLHLVCRLLLEKKKHTLHPYTPPPYVRRRQLGSPFYTSQY